MSYGRIMSNANTGMQRIFGNARNQMSRAANGLKKAWNEPMGKPYSKMTSAERLAHDADMFEMDHAVVQRHHEKMVKRYGANYADQFADDFELPTKGKGWW